MKQQYIQVFKNKNFMKLFIADIISRFGDSLDAIVMTIIVYSITQSASWSALIFAVNKLPTIFIQPLAGAYIEKKNKKLIMVISDLIRAGLVGIIATQLMFATLTRWDLLIITFLISIVESFRQPTSMPVMAQILQSEEMEVGLSLSQSSSKVVEFIGFGVSGVFIATLGNHIVVYIDMMTFLLSALIILTMSIKPILKDVQEKTYFFTEFKAGIRIIFQYPKIKIFVFLAIFLNAIITPLSSLQAPLVEEVLHSTAIMLSVISTALTLGMIVGSVIYPMVKEKMNIKMIVILSAYSITVAYIGSCFSGIFIQNILLLYIMIATVFFVMGLGISMINMFAFVEMLKVIPQDYLARVSSLVTSLCVCMVPVVSFILSGLAYTLSTFSIFVIVGVINIVIFILFFQKKLNIL